MENHLRDCVMALLLSDRETGGRPVLPEGSRDLVNRALLRLLTHAEELDRYLGDLLASAEEFSGIRHSEPLTDEETRLLITAGPAALPGELLARLMLSPMALSAARTDLAYRTL